MLQCSYILTVPGVVNRRHAACRFGRAKARPQGMTHGPGGQMQECIGQMQGRTGRMQECGGRTQERNGVHPGSPLGNATPAACCELSVDPPGARSAGRPHALPARLRSGGPPPSRTRAEQRRSVSGALSDPGRHPPHCRRGLVQPIRSAGVAGTSRNGHKFSRRKEFCSATATADGDGV